MKGQGSTYLRGKTYWIRYAWHGKEYRESAKTGDEKKAKRLLQQRLKAVGTPLFVEPKEQRYTLSDMLEKIELRYMKKELRSFKNIKYCWPYIEAGFPFHRVVDIDKHAVEKYQAARLKAGAAPATINREVSYLKLGFRLLGLPVPAVEKLAEDNVRTGFIRLPEFNALLAEIEGAEVRDIIEFLYHSAWRSSEPKAMKWNWLDLDSWTVRLPAEFSKNKKLRTLPLEGTLRDIIERRIEAHILPVPMSFIAKGNRSSRFVRHLKQQQRQRDYPI